MVDYFSSVLHESPTMVYFIILGLGYLLGKVRIGTFDLGPVAGVLFLGLIFGHFGYGGEIPLQSVGFLLFIYSVGFQSGPKFFTVIRQDGLKYFTLALVIAGTGFGVAMGLSKVMAMKPGASAGILAGGLTSTPTLAAAQEAIRTGMIAPPAGFSADDVVTNITTGYAITYIFGLIGLLFLVRLLPKVMGISLVDEAEKLATRDRRRVLPSERIVTRAYHILRGRVIGASISELYDAVPGLTAILKIKRDGEFIDVRGDTVIQAGDRVSVMGYLERMKAVPENIGPEVTDEDLLDIPTESIRVVVTRKRAVGMTVTRKLITEKFGCILERIQRLGIEVPLDPGVRLERSDVLFLSGPRSNLDLVGEEIGHVERMIDETDLLTFGLGIAAGIFLGQLSVTIGGIEVGLGSAGGLLASGLTIGFLRSIHPTFGRVPSAARWVFMEMGLLFFMVGVGLRAGRGIVEALYAAGPTLFLSGMLVTVTPVVVGFIVGRYVLKINPVLLLGSITGSMTSGAALSIVNSEARSQVPALGYTGAYAFANVLLTVAGSVILTI